MHRMPVLTRCVIFLVLDKQGFKDEGSLFKFLPDEESPESSSKLRDLVKKSSQKLDFRIVEHYKTKTVLLVSLISTVTVCV